MYVSSGYKCVRRQAHDPYPPSPTSIVASTPANVHRYARPPVFPLSMFKTDKGPTCAWFYSLPKLYPSGSVNQVYAFYVATPGIFWTFVSIQSKPKFWPNIGRTLLLNHNSKIFGGFFALFLFKLLYLQEKYYFSLLSRISRQRKMLSVICINTIKNVFQNDLNIWRPVVFSHSLGARQARALISIIALQCHGLIW